MVRAGAYGAGIARLREPQHGPRACGPNPNLPAPESTPYGTICGSQRNLDPTDRPNASIRRAICEGLANSVKAAHPSTTTIAASNTQASTAVMPPNAVSSNEVCSISSTASYHREQCSSEGEIRGSGAALFALRYRLSVDAVFSIRCKQVVRTPVTAVRARPPVHDAVPILPAPRSGIHPVFAAARS